MKSLQGAVSVAFVLVWSSGYLVGSLATAVIAPLTVTLWRFVLAAAVLAVIAFGRHERWPRGGRALARVAGVGVLLFAVQFGGLYIGLADGMPAGTTALIACTAPMLVAVAGAGLGWERLRPLQWAGIAVGVVGVSVTLADRVGRPPSLAALLWTLLGLAGLAAGTLLQRTVSGTAGPSALAATEVGAAMLVLAVVVAELVYFRSGIFRTAQYWWSIVIVFAFQVPVDGWLTKLSDPIVIYNPDEMLGLRMPWDIPIEDFGFGFAMVTLAILLWRRWLDRRLSSQEAIDK